MLDKYEPNRYVTQKLPDIAVMQYQSTHDQQETNVMDPNSQERIKIESDFEE